MTHSFPTRRSSDLHADDTRPVEHCTVQQFLGRDLDLVIAGEPLRIQLVELNRDTKLRPASTLDLDTALVAKDAGKWGGIVNDVLNSEGTPRRGSSQKQIGRASWRERMW